MNIALILIAGSGTRIHSDIPKQFIKIDDKPIFLYSTITFNNNANIDKIILVTNKDYIDIVKSYCKQYKINKLIDVIQGGSSRKESTYLGLLRLKHLNIKDDDIILIHDGARALVSNDIIDKNILACKKYNAVITTLKASDTICESTNGEYITNNFNRDEIYINQTPQSFRFDIIYKAHELINKDHNIYTDDANIVNKYEYKIYLVDGDKTNFKITTDFDLKLFEYIIKNNKNI